MTLPFVQNDGKRKFSCFVCSRIFSTVSEYRQHIIDSHEEGREYLVCPLERCRIPVRDLRAHFKKHHPFNKCPACQLRATVFYDARTPNKRRKLPTFEEGYMESKKNQRPVHYRSGYEKEVYNCLEQMNDVLRYVVEPICIPYYLKGKRRNYYPDLKVEFVSGNVEVWEIKPANQTGTPQNQAKFKAVEQFCRARGWQFEVITETRIQQLKKRSGQ